jgi:hypothetical protein
LKSVKRCAILHLIVFPAGKRYGKSNAIRLAEMIIWPSSGGKY